MSAVLHSGQRYVTTGVLLLFAVLSGLVIGFLVVRDTPMALLLPMTGAGLIALLLLLRRPFLLLCLQTAVLSTMPLLRVHIGPVPVFIAEFLLGLCIASVLFSNDDRAQHKHPFGTWLILFAGSSVLASLVLMITTQIVIESLYGLIRHLLVTVGIFYVANKVLYSRERVATIITIIVWGAVANAVFALLQSLPPTQYFAGSVMETFYSASSYQAERYLAGSYDRAVGLFSAATALAGYLAMSVPLLRRKIAPSSKARWVSRLAMFITLMALIMTYARQGLLALLLGLLLTRWLVKKANRMHSIIHLSALLLVLFSFGAVSNVINTDVFQERLQTTESIKARLVDGPTRYASYWRDRPLRALVGVGPEAGELPEHGLVGGDDALAITSGFYSQSFVLMAYENGMVAGIAYIMLVYLVVRTMTRTLRLSQEIPGAANDREDLIALLASLMVAIMAHMFDNYFGVSLNFKQLFWLMLAASFQYTQFVRQDHAERLREVGQVMPSATGSALEAALLPRI